jgi:DNA modification methylase
MTVKLYLGDCLQVLGRLDLESVHCVVTSPPYWGLRDYGVHGQLGLEATPEEHVERMVEVFRAVRRVMRKDATLWLNYGDTYASGEVGRHDSLQSAGLLPGKAGVRTGIEKVQKQRQQRPRPRGLKPKDLVGMPWRVAFALQADGWYLRSDIIWAKPNPMPESVTDRPTKSHEHLFLLAKSERYYYAADAVREPHAEKTLTHRGQGSCGKASSQDSLGKVASGSWSKTVRIVDPRGCNLRDVWTIPTAPFPGAHFATFPTKLVEPCIKAGCPEGGTVLDPFGGAGTVGLVADRLGRNCGSHRAEPGVSRVGSFTDCERRAALCPGGCHQVSEQGPMTDRERLERLEATGRRPRPNQGVWDGLERWKRSPRRRGFGGG